VTLDAARREMSAIAAELSRLYPATNATTGVTLVPLDETLVGGSRRALLILFGAVGFVLLIACANVASLQLAQAVRRRREIAVRSAMGAGRERLARQLLTESLLLGIMGGAAGVALAYWGITAIRTLAPANLPRVDELRTDPAVLVFALVVSVATALLFGLAPVVESWKVRLSESLTADGRTSTASRSRRRAHSALVVSEVALAMILLVGAGLLVRSFTTLLDVERGFESDNVLVVTLQAWSYYPTGPQRAAFVPQATERLSAIPGVRAVGMTSSLPLSYPIGQARARVTVEGAPVASEAEVLTEHVAAATAGYFQALGIPLRQGRLMRPADDAASASVAVVNESFARRYWPTESPLGKRITFAFQGQPKTREIIGVVGDVRHDGLASDPRRSVFVPHPQAPSGAMHLVIRTTVDAAALAPAVRRELAALNGAMPLSEMTTVDALLRQSLRERRFHLALLGAFSLTALLLAAVGIYGMMSHSTSERTHEIGVRVAIGARPPQVVWMIVRQGGRLALIGVVMGLAGAGAMTRVLGAMLFQVSPLDPVAFGGAVAGLVAAALVACWIPARRAAAVLPTRALQDG
jgi:predicted permease